MRSRVPSLIAMMVLLSGCAFVDTTPAGEQVRVREADEIHSCRHIGSTSGSVLAEIARVPRNPHRVEAELDALARNAAAEMGGDTIVPAGSVQDGRRSYEVYRCRP